ncbi:hypothetical protein ACFQFQ_06045 [Sulfitobacter porphyrae]|uniref:Uncharacterized protein n=1 Tax=Sulfitobacter porphyrae TaxID=1246864 RepID=A0ABW2B0K8_9RHOB
MSVGFDPERRCVVGLVANDEIVRPVNIGLQTPVGKPTGDAGVIEQDLRLGAFDLDVFIVENLTIHA